MQSFQQSLLWSLRVQATRSDSREGHFEGHFDHGRVTSMASDGGSGDESVSGSNGSVIDEEDVAAWNGDVPADAPPWCSALHRLITRVLGDECKSGGEPNWWPDNASLFVEDEEERRGLPCGALLPFVYEAYNSDLVIAEYSTGKPAQGLLICSGEKLGEWEVFTTFYVKPKGDELRWLQVDQKVTVGEYPFCEDAVVARIIRGTKAAGRATQAKTQHCYYVLLQLDTDGSFTYAALQHVHDAGVEVGGFACKFTSALGGNLPTANELAEFQPKSVPAVAKAASVFVRKLNPEKKKKKRKADRCAGGSDSESDS